jgi:ArsR family transcriptional regulator, arsenate/arsenite/antimonite-responsive transcriptional repressor
MGDVSLRLANTGTTEECVQRAQSCTEAPDLPRQLKALSEPTRLRIVDLLMEGVQCNCEIAQRLNLSFSLISHHMRVLRLAGLVQSEQSPDDERWVYYSVDLAATEQLLGEMQRLLNPARLQSRSPSCGPQSKGCGS